MKNIFVIGAGRSSPALIKYLLDHSAKLDWRITVGDLDYDHARKACRNHPRSRAIVFDVTRAADRKKLVAESDIVVSLLPPNMHLKVAKECIRAGKNMATASYVSPEIRALDARARKADVLLLNEVGVDPGLDHMSAMDSIHRIRENGGELLSFKSYAGGLVAPRYDNNIWRYKLTWNPRNVVLAGQGVVKFKRNGRYKYIPYQGVFRRIEKLSVLKAGKFEAYPNRDSLSYRCLYGLEEIPTILRCTLRRPGFCEAWDVFVQLGLTDDTYVVEGSGELTYRQFVNSFLKYSRNQTIEKKLERVVGPSKKNVLKKIKWLGLLEDRPIGLPEATPARILQRLLEEKWAFGHNDRDMIVMHHEFRYVVGKKEYKHTSSLVTVGKKPPFTAMARTVGLPLAIAVRLILQGQVKEKGVQIPILPCIYVPALKELRRYGIEFIEKTVRLKK